MRLNATADARRWRWQWNKKDSTTGQRERVGKKFFFFAKKVRKTAHSTRSVEIFCEFTSTKQTIDDFRDGLHDRLNFINKHLINYDLQLWVRTKWVIWAKGKHWAMNSAVSCVLCVMCVCAFVCTVAIGWSAMKSLISYQPLVLQVVARKRESLRVWRDGEKRKRERGVLNACM